jgi:hypothetical protein
MMQPPCGLAPQPPATALGARRRAVKSRGSLWRCLPRQLRELLRPLSSFSLHVHTRIAESPVHRLRNLFVDIRLHGRLWCCQAPYDFPLTLTRNFAIAKKGC